MSRRVIILSLGVASLVLAVILWRFGTRITRQSLSSRIANRSDVIEGDILCRPNNLAWTVPGSYALILVVSGTCPACSSVRSFYDEAYEYFSNHRLPAYYVLSTEPRHNDAANELKASGKKVIRVNLQEFGVTRVPTILEVNGTAHIVSKWTGTVPPDRRDQVFSALISHTSLESYETVEESELLNLSRKPNVDVIALSAVKSISGVSEKLMPVGELAVRAAYELSPDRLTVIDCSTSLTRSCDEAALILTKGGLKVVAVGMLPRVQHCGDQ